MTICIYVSIKLNISQSLIVACCKLLVYEREIELDHYNLAELECPSYSVQYYSGGPTEIRGIRTRVEGDRAI